MCHFAVSLIVKDPYRSLFRVPYAGGVYPDRQARNRAIAAARAYAEAYLAERPEEASLLQLEDSSCNGPLFSIDLATGEERDISWSWDEEGDE